MLSMRDVAASSSSVARDVRRDGMAVRADTTNGRSQRHIQATIIPATNPRQRQRQRRIRRDKRSSQSTIRGSFISSDNTPNEMESSAPPAFPMHLKLANRNGDILVTEAVMSGSSSTAGGGEVSSLPAASLLDIGSDLLKPLDEGTDVTITSDLFGPPGGCGTVLVGTLLHWEGSGEPIPVAIKKPHSQTAGAAEITPANSEGPPPPPARVWSRWGDIDPPAVREIVLHKYACDVSQGCKGQDTNLVPIYGTVRHAASTEYGNPAHTHDVASNEAQSGILLRMGYVEEVEAPWAVVQGMRRTPGMPVGYGFNLHQFIAKFFRDDAVEYSGQNARHFYAYTMEKWDARDGSGEQVDLSRNYLAFFYSAFAQIERGLAVMHGKGLGHGDLKPANIMIDWMSSSLMLGDFGSAGFLSDLSNDDSVINALVAAADEEWPTASGKDLPGYVARNSLPDSKTNAGRKAHFKKLMGQFTTDDGFRLSANMGTPFYAEPTFQFSREAINLEEYNQKISEYSTTLTGTNQWYKFDQWSAGVIAMELVMGTIIVGGRNSRTTVDRSTGGTVIARFYDTVYNAASLEAAKEGLRSFMEIYASRFGLWAHINESDRGDIVDMLARLIYSGGERPTARAMCEELQAKLVTVWPRSIMPSSVRPSTPIPNPWETWSVPAETVAPPPDPAPLADVADTADTADVRVRAAPPVVSTPNNGADGGALGSSE